MMKKLVLGLLVSVFFVGITQGEEKIVWVMVGSANIRSGPSRQAEVIARAKWNDQLLVIQEQEEWYKVKLPSGETGWIYGQLCSSKEAESPIEIVKNYRPKNRGRTVNEGLEIIKEVFVQGGLMEDYVIEWRSENLDGYRYKVTAVDRDIYGRPLETIFEVDMVTKKVEPLNQRAIDVLGLLR